MPSILVLSLICLALAARSQTSSLGLQVSPTTIDFGETAVQSDSPTRKITVSNPTQSVIMIEQILASGIDFAQKNDCAQRLAAGVQCTIQVSFTPAVPGPRMGSLEVMEANGNPHFVALTGIGR